MKTSCESSTNSKRSLRRRLSLLIVSSAALASPQLGLAQTIALAPASGHPGIAVTATGTKFGDSEAVDVYVDTTDTLLLVSSATGGVTGSLQIPASESPGTHYVTMIGRHSGVAAQLGFRVTTPWSESGFGAAHRAWNPYENTVNTTNVSSLGPLWASTNANVLGATPVVANGLVYISTADGLEALSTTTGAVRWTAGIGAQFYGSPAVALGNVYVGSVGDIFYAFNAGTGKVLWTATLGAGVLSSPVVVNGIVYIGCSDNKLYALNASTGAIVWSYATSGAIDSSPAVVNGVVYVGSQDNSVYALNATTGTLLWSYPTGGEVESSPVVADGLVYVASDDGNMYALRTVASPINGNAAGSLLWKASGASYESPAAANGNLFYGYTTLYCVNDRTGAQIWSFTTDSYIRGGVITANGIVYVTSATGILYAINAANGSELWHTQSGASALGNPTIADGVIYVNGYESGTTAYSLLAGADVAKRSPPDVSSLHPNMSLRVVEP